MHCARARTARRCQRNIIAFTRGRLCAWVRRARGRTVYSLHHVAHARTRSGAVLEGSGHMVPPQEAQSFSLHVSSVHHALQPGLSVVVLGAHLGLSQPMQASSSQCASVHHAAQLLAAGEHLSLEQLVQPSTLHLLCEMTHTRARASQSAGIVSRTTAACKSARQLVAPGCAARSCRSGRRARCTFRVVAGRAVIYAAMI